MDSVMHITNSRDFVLVCVMYITGEKVVFYISHKMWPIQQAKYYHEDSDLICYIWNPISNSNNKNTTKVGTI